MFDRVPKTGWENVKILSTWTVGMRRKTPLAPGQIFLPELGGLNSRKLSRSWGLWDTAESGAGMSAVEHLVPR